MTQRIEHIIIQDIDEQHSPPSQNVLMLEIIPKGRPIHGTRAEIVSLTIAKYDCDDKGATLTNMAQVCIDGDVLTDAMNLLRKVNR